MEPLKLTRDEKNILESVYGRQTFGGVGYNPNQLEDVLESNAWEQKFFANKNFVSPYFFVQTLYKVRGTVNPMKFNVAVNRMLKDNANLRVNFCNVGTRTVKVVRPVENVKPEIIFRNLTQTDRDELDDEFRKVMEADMRRDVDLRHDPLIRFAVYKTDEDTFAVLITLAQLIADNFDAAQLFSHISGATIEPMPKNFVNKLSPKDQAVIRDYWAKVLDNAPPAASLPFEREGDAPYRQKTFHTTISADILSDLRWRAQSNRVMLTAILQSAWGFMLQVVNKRRDVLFCQILSAGDEAELNVIPVRVAGDNTATIEQIVRKQFRQLVVSQPYSCVDWSNLSGLAERGKKLFDHFLSFKEFQSNELIYLDTEAEERGAIIVRNSWDARGMKLGAYFRYSEKNLSITFLYDEKKFFDYGVERLCALYKLILQQMLSDWNAKFSNFLERLDKRINLHMSPDETFFGSSVITLGTFTSAGYQINLQLAEKFSQDERKKIRDFISQMPILQGRFAGTIGLFDDGQAKLITRYEGDRIFGDMLAENFIFVMSGKLVRNADTGDGWFNPLDIVGKNAFINPANFLDKQRIKLSAEVLTEQAELLTIPHDVFIETLRKNPDLAQSIMNYALEQMERWQMLWLQS